jgi:hypothetical protein
VARAIQASARFHRAVAFENVGKWSLDETGKDPVNNNGKEIFAGFVPLRDSSRQKSSRHSEARESASPEAQDSGFDAVGIAPE